MARSLRSRSIDLCWLLLLPLGCGRPAPADATPATPSQEAPALHAVKTPELALGYVPGDSVTDKLILAAQESVRRTPDRVAAYHNLALLLMRRKRETSSPAFNLYIEDVLAAAESRAPGDRPTKVFTAMLRHDEHRFRQAAAMARELVASEPDDTTAHLILGDALLELGDYEEAIDSYQAAMDLRPDLRSYNRAAYLRWLHGDFEGAVEVIELAIDSGSARDPESIAWCYVDLGNMYRQRGDGLRTLRAADRALALVPGYAPALSLRARALRQQGQDAAAIEVLTATVEKRPLVEDLLLLAEWLAAEGRTDDSSHWRAQAEALSGEDPRPMALHLARHNEEPARALELAERELDSRRNIAALDTHALALLRANRVDEARLQIAEATKLGTRRADLQLHSALIALAAGDAKAAREHLDTARGINPNADPVLVAELSKELGDA